MTLTTIDGGPGFQGSETSSAELVVYANDRGDPVLPEAGLNEIQFIGRQKDDDRPSLIGVTTNKPMGAPSGTWSATVKADQLLGRNLDLRDIIVDDQWVDITFLRHNRPYHTMRGLVDRVQKATTVVGKGVTSTVYTITGRDFPKIWEITPLWFSKYASQNIEGENIVGAAVFRIFTELQAATPNPSEAVQAFLFNFLQALGKVGRANWVMGVGMPNVNATSAAFIDNVKYDTSFFTNDPPRKVSAFNFLDPAGAMSWAMAQNWSDPVFCEMWADTLPSQARFGSGLSVEPGTESDIIADLGALENEEQIPIDRTNMMLMYRDRPFPTVAEGLDSPWFSLPTATVARQEVVADNVGRGGEERFNAFFVSSRIAQELIKNDLIEITAPFWDPDDILRHGLRRFDVDSLYVGDFDKIDSNDSKLLAITKTQREKVRDWYAINPYLLSGTIGLGHGRPDIRIGMRLKIPGTLPELDQSYYIEQVTNAWQFGRGIRTSLGVTRGWVGTDNDYLNALNKIADRYTGSDRQLPVGDNVVTSSGIA